MQEPQPYQKNTINIDETNPALPLVVPSNIEGIKVSPSPTDFNAKPNVNTVNEVLNSIEAPSSIKAFSVDYNSNLNVLPDLTSFRNIEYFHIAGRKIKAYEDISNFESLKSVFLVNFKSKKLDVADNVSLENFRAIRGSIHSINFSADYFLLQSCRQLKYFEDINAKSISLDGCHSLELESLKNVRCLMRLKILGRKSLESLSFIADCIDLQEVSITATDMRNTDIGNLDNSKNIRKVFFGQCSKVLLKELSQKAPSILMSNGDLTLIDGQEKEFSYYGSA